MSADWSPTAPSEMLRRRAGLMADIRTFFAQRDVLEVETPALSGAGNSDPGIEQWPAGERHWLRTSPEYAMKRLLAAGSGDIYELGRVFRRGESGRHHNPEFTLLEWYRVGWTYRELASEVVDLVNACRNSDLLPLPVADLTYGELFQQTLELDPHAATIDELAAAADRLGLGVSQPQGLDRDEWLDLLISQGVQPRLPRQGLTVVRDYPASQAALARLRREPGQPAVAERFEVYLGQQELANGYQELTDAVEQRQRFEAEQAHRRRSGLPETPLDEHLLSALDHGLPDCAGVALGVDRLLMALTGAEHLDEVLAFPHPRA